MVIYISRFSSLRYKLKGQYFTGGFLIDLYLMLPSSIAQGIHYYIDPGTGSLVIQILIGSALGARFFVKLFWNKIKQFFTRKSSRYKDRVE